MRNSILAIVLLLLFATASFAENIVWMSEDGTVSQWKISEDDLIPMPEIVNGRVVDLPDLSSTKETVLKDFPTKELLKLWKEEVTEGKTTESFQRWVAGLVYDKIREE